MDAFAQDRDVSRSWVRELVAPLVSGVLVGVVLLAAGLVLR
jgi:hypothetical protein